MRTSRRNRTHPPALGFNAIPMVDVIFLLTIFFMLVSRFSSAEQIPLELPKPFDSRAEVTKFPQRVVINCRLANPSNPADSDVLYSIGPNRPESLGMISNRLANMKQKSGELNIIVRADKRLTYGHVRAVMRVIAQNGIDMLNVVAHVSEGRSE